MLDNFLIAASLANLLLMWEWFNALHPEFLIFNIHSVSLSGIVAFFLVFLSYTGIIFILLRLCAAKRKVVASFFTMLLLALFILPWLHARNFYHLGEAYPFFFSPAHFLGNWGRLNQAKYFLLLVAFITFSSRYCRKINLVLRGILLILVPFCLLTFGQLIWRHVTIPSEEKEPTNIVAGNQLKTKTLWIVFDAFDYNYTFNLRDKETKKAFPEIDRFKAGSFSFSHAIAPTPMTTYSMSSYFLGKTVVEFDLFPYETATATVYETKETLKIKEQETLLSSAKKLGATVGVIGWHIPYCILYKKDVDYCVWFSPTQWPYQSDILRNYLSVIRHTFLKRDSLKRVRRQIYDLTLEKSLRLVNQGLPNLTLFHFSVPHFPGINNLGQDSVLPPDQQEISDYYSNLELADQALGQIRSILEKKNEWDNTNVIITSDHWLRYAPDSYMNKYGKKMFEIPLMVKLAKNAEPTNYDKPVPTLHIANLLLGTLNGKISTTQDVKRWAEENTVANYDDLINKTSVIQEKVYYHDND